MTLLLGRWRYNDAISFYLMYSYVDTNWRCCCSKTKENIYINKHSSFIEELTVFTLLGGCTPNMYLLVQILDEVLKKKESYKQHCQAESLCKFDCSRPMNLLYVHLDIVHHPDSAILIFHPCLWYSPYSCHQYHLVGVL